MRTLLIALSSIVIGVAFGYGLAVVQIRMSPWDPRLDEGAATAAATPSAPARERIPKAVIDRTVYDFGTIDRDTGGTRDFVIKNAGDAPLTVSLDKPSSRCLTTQIQREVIPPGDSGKVHVVWKPAEDPTSNRQTATVITDDPERQQIKLTLTGQVKVLLRPSSTELAIGRFSPGDAATAKVRVWCYADEPLTIVSHHWSEVLTAEYYEATIQPLSAAELSEEPLARSGVSIQVTAKPGLPVGPLQQKIVLKTNVAQVPTVTLPINGIVSNEIAIVSPRWEAEQGILLLGTISSRAGRQVQALLVVRGPYRKEVTFRVASATPDVLKVTLGQPRESNNGLVVETPLTIDIPPGSPSMYHLSADGGGLGQITLETTHPRVPTLQIPVSFAIEE